MMEMKVVRHTELTFKAHSLPELDPVGPQIVKQDQKNLNYLNISETFRFTEVDEKNMGPKTYL